MNDKISRRKFIQSGSAAYVASALSGAALVGTASVALAQTTQTTRPPVLDRGPRLDLDMVKEFVIAGHGNLENVKKLLAREPKLINAAWDWGGGDWETALGGASHTGHKEIALYLLEKGARMDLFAATMLGKIEIVKAAVNSFPDIRNVPGPHGITLLAHAKAGKEESAAVLKYLESYK